MGRSRSNSRRWASIFSYLPLELWAEVLARLPVKTLLKFRCVCKEWKSLIENPNFAASHLNCYKNNSELTHLLVIESYTLYCPSSYFRVRSTDTFASVRSADTFRRANYIECLSNIPCYFRVEGCAVGLLLWKFFYSTRRCVTDFVVFNPSIRKSLQIPIPSPFTIGSWVGVGYDAVNRDYKVVFVSVETNSSSSPSPSQPPPTRVPVLVHIYSISSRTWKSFSPDAQFLQYPDYWYASIFLKGAIHWMGYDVSTGPCPSFGSHILAFDLHKEVFNSFQLPRDRNTGAFPVLAVLGESLAWLHFHRKLRNYTLSVMEQYGVAESWVKRFTFDLEYPYEHFLYLKRDGELFFTERRQVKAYEIESGKIKDLTRSYSDTIAFMDTFVESLVLLT